jgi:hypothetical protein
MLENHFYTFLQVENAAELIGYFVPPDTSCKLVLATMEDSANARQLRVFAAILKGSSRTTLKEKLTDIGNFLKRSETCCSKEVLTLVEGIPHILRYFGSSLFTTACVYIYE